ncbi:MAG TPA: hypothetical protein VF438_03950 [Candidatus Paceibacterota bacterium]
MNDPFSSFVIPFQTNEQVLPLDEVDLTIPWETAIDNISTDVVEPFRSIRKVADLFPPQEIRLQPHHLTLLNFANGDGNWPLALQWMHRAGRRPTNPRQIFALVRRYPNLAHSLGLERVAIAATETCEYDGRVQACAAWWHGDAQTVPLTRGVELEGIACFGRADCWFAFF